MGKERDEVRGTGKRLVTKIKWIGGREVGLRMRRWKGKGNEKRKRKNGISGAK